MTGSTPAGRDCAITASSPAGRALRYFAARLTSRIAGQAARHTRMNRVWAPLVPTAWEGVTRRTAKGG